ncbi:MAG: DMT family transporter [Rhodospirillales bacterium]
MVPTGASARSLAFLRSPHLAAAGGMFLWAITIIIVRWARDFAPPLGLSFWRAMLGIVLLSLLAGPALKSDWRILRHHLPMVFWLGFLLMVGGNMALFIGLQHTTAINAGLINAIEPTAIVALAVLLFRDPVSLRQWIGIAISFAGVVVLAIRADIDVLLNFGFNVGDLWVIGAMFSWAMYANWLRKVPRGLSPYGLVIAMLAAGCILGLPLYVWESVTVRPMTFDLNTLIAIGLLGVLSSTLGIWLWNYAVAGLGPGSAGLYINLIPPYTVALAILFLGESLMTFHVIGIAVIGAGLYLAIFDRRK